ncbi:hypothetical protein PFISCL1PPCAC_12765, partial [Pristionchus fissidentatus]
MLVVSIVHSFSNPPSPSASSETTIQSSRPLLARVRAAYDKMCFARLMGELFARKDPPMPLDIDASNHPVYPATFGGMNHANRVLMSCIMEFGKTLFPEFERLKFEEKRSIAVKFFYTFRKFDNVFRSEKYFADNIDRNFGTYIMWLSEDIVEHFFDDLEKGRGDIEQAKKVMLEKCDKPRVGREFLQRVNLDEEEFLAMITLMFWAQNGLDEIPEVTKIEERYRSEIFSELHNYYREVLKMENYASRLGELQMFLPLYERHQGVKEMFEVLRLLDIYSEDCFT